ncbi:energy transducer TonB [Shewanella sp. HL-SH4]|uniref:energy transducer TonB n=1 Tax=Shewanella sp. HL-SH4 TaxID=3436240 RepID=UPI003EB8BA5F
MIKNYLGFLIITLMASGCASTKAENEYTNLPVTQNELKSSKWAELVRFPARYPESAVMNSIEGCVTVEYVVTPQNEVKDIKVITTTEKEFGLAAAKVVKSWKWSDLPKGIITQAVKTQTRFDFCFDKQNQSCTTIKPKYSCPSDDIIYSTGMRIN